jgi:hypothetical protein
MQVNVLPEGFPCTGAQVTVNQRQIWQTWDIFPFPDRCDIRREVIDQCSGLSQSISR